MGLIEQASSGSPSTLRGVRRRPGPLLLSSLSIAVSFVLIKLGLVFSDAGCFGRIVPSEAAKESWFAIHGNLKMKLQGSNPLGRESLQSQSCLFAKKQIYDQRANRCSRMTR
jgi:hypothetical protein